MKVFDIDETVEIAAEVTSTKTGEAVDVDSELFRILLPKGDLANPSVQHPAKGSYLCFYDPTEAGVHELLFLGKGDNKAAKETKFRVKQPRVSRD